MNETDTPHSQGWMRRNFALLAGVGAVAAVVGLPAFVDYEIIPSIVPAQNFGVRIRNAQVVSDEMKPGLYWTRPILDDVYHFPNNTIIMQGEAGSSKNAADQNTIAASYRIHSRVNPKAGFIALHIDKMKGDGGVEMVQGFASQAVDSVVGNQRAVDTLNDPKNFLKAFVGNLQWRLRQNNVPMTIDTVELLTLSSGGTRMPVQLRIRPDGEVESMADIKSAVGPGAIPVPQAVPQRPNTP